MLKAANEKDASRLEASKQVLMSLAKLEAVRVLEAGEETPSLPSIRLISP